jgi:hypothetical protein
MRGNFGASDPLVESCINDLKARLVQAGLIKVGTPSGVTDALLFGAIMALSGFDAAAKLAGPTSSAYGSLAKLQACSLVKQALEKFAPGVLPPPAPPSSPIDPTPQQTPAQQASAATAELGFGPWLVVLGLGAAAAMAGFFFLRPAPARSR